ncbi:MAG: hypothetical protein H5T62_13460 [Anaerolineae bacterium]|nr:hypothetical protein [Anaerolineae bacterium]
MSQEGILELILQELRQISSEIKALRETLSDMGPVRPLGVEEAEKPPATMVGEEMDEEDFLTVFDWLASRNITVKNYKQEETADAVFDQLAVFLGERFASLKRLHDQIRRHLSTGGSFTLNLESSGPEEIANTTQFCTWLHQYAFLSSYRYNRYSKTIYAAPQRIGKVINFFTGGWFERFVFLKVASLLSQHGLSYVHLLNPQISLPSGDDFELDLVYLIEDEPLWLECKTGDYQAYVAKYADVRPTLAVPRDRSILVVLGISDELTSQLTHLYDITVANENNFLDMVASALGLAEIPHEVTVNGAVPAGKLSTLLNRAGLRPLPEIRPAVIEQLIDVVSSMHRPSTLVEVKSILAERTGESKSKLQDILNAVVKGGCLVDEQGELVYSFTVPFAGLVSRDSAEIEGRCMTAYIQAVLRTDPAFFDSSNNVAEFEQVTGGRMHDPATIERLREQIQEEGGRVV